MSYTEYLRRKAASAPVILDPSPRKVDASQFTSMARMKANATFFTSTRVGVVNNVSDPSSTSYPNSIKQVKSYTKVAGGRVPDASVYSSFVGGNAIREDTLVGIPTGKILMNSNDAGSIKACIPIPGPAPFSGGQFGPNNVSMTGSGFLNNTKHCLDLGRVEPHVASELGHSLFVDTMRPAKPSSNTCGGGAQTPCKPVIHTHPTDSVHMTRYQARPQYAQKGVTNVSPDMPYKQGGPVPSKHLKYVEKHHGNDLLTMVNGRKPVPGKYQIPAGTPAHLKINDPIGPRVPGM